MASTAPLAGLTAYHTRCVGGNCYPPPLLQILYFSASATCGRTNTATRRTNWHWRMRRRRPVQLCPHASTPTSPGQGGRRAWPPTQIRRSPASSCGASAPAFALGSQAASGVNMLSATSNQLGSTRGSYRTTLIGRNV